MEYYQPLKSRSFIEDQLLRNRKTFVYVLQVNCEVKVRYPHPFSELGHSSNTRMRESAVQNNRISEPDVRCYPPTARCYATMTKLWSNAAVAILALTLMVTMISTGIAQSNCTSDQDCPRGQVCMATSDYQCSVQNPCPRLRCVII
uniref:Uncharacterized protein n=1 Tax=Timema douglasi TaxID=61478 RepID=A0A7R8VUM6_TIMDO|nr:unnamed protein product [Timema douglasi]